MSMYMGTGPFTCVSTVHTSPWVDLECSHQQSVNCGRIIPNNGEAKKNLFGFAIKYCLAYGGFGNIFTFLGLARADVGSCSLAAPDSRVISHCEPARCQALGKASTKHLLQFSQPQRRQALLVPFYR